MNKMLLVCVVATVGLGGCASMPSEETMNCVQPNRRVAVEVGGAKAAKPPKLKPGEKAKKLRPENVMSKALTQGNSSWDFGKAELKDGGKQELDKLVNLLNTGTKRDPRPTKVSSIIIAGHTDRYEAESGPANLSEMRAQAVMKYLTGKGMDPKLMFWECKGAKEPVPVTKFCAN
jgi:outer membrane protein OmpA-like peptidoglycan-associated protein